MLDPNTKRDERKNEYWFSDHVDCTCYSCGLWFCVGNGKNEKEQEWQIKRR